MAYRDNESYTTQKLEQLEQQIKEFEDKINNVNTHFSRIEEKINYIINLLETLWSDDTEEEEDEYIDDSNEGWLPELDAWKEDEE